MKAIKCEIYKPHTGDCSNGGISSKFNEILLISPDGFIEVDGSEPNLCELGSVSFGGRTHYHIKPVAKPTGAGWMYGGTVVACSDSRFPFDYPLKLHDRQETWEQYEALSH